MWWWREVCVVVVGGLVWGEMRSAKRQPMLCDGAARCALYDGVAAVRSDYGTPHDPLSAVLK